MSPQDVFYYSIATGVIVTVAILAYLVHQLTLTLKSLRDVIEDIRDTTRDLVSVKNGLKVGTLALIAKLFEKRKRR